MKYWTKERAAEVVRLYQSGLSLSEVRAIVRAKWSRVREAITAAGVPIHPRSVYHDKYVAAFRDRPKIERWVWTPERDVQVAEMYLSDWLQSEIADYFSTSNRMVHESLKRLDIKLPRTGRRNPSWKGGRLIDKDGYVLIYAPDHPNARKNGHVLEHRMAMAAHLGRALEKREVVHHERSKRDNKADELRLFPNNAEHLRHELTGRVPNWTPDGRARLLEVVRGPRRRSTKRWGPPKTDAPPSP